LSGFRYVEPVRLDAAVGFLADPNEDAHLLAGGTALVPLLRTGYVLPSLVVGMRRLPGLNEIRLDGGHLAIGSLVTHAEVAASPVVRSGWSVLAEACERVGTVRIRNQGTLGGNVVHADPNQDPPPVLLLLDARARIVGPDGERTVAVDDLFLDVFATTIDRAEILVELVIPALPEGSRTAYAKFLPRSQDDYATVAVAGLVRIGGDGRIAEARVAIGGAGPRPIRARAVEEALTGQTPGVGTIQAASATLDAVLDPIDDSRGSAEYKRAMARVWVERVLGELCDVVVP
jgi:carbon-monoxide dehydrogenase medium subunit